MLAKDFRKKAWADLNGKWGTFAVIELIILVISAVCSGLSVIGIGAIILLIVEGPLTLGVTGVSLKAVGGENFTVENMFDGFKNFVNALVLYLTNAIFTALWSLLFIIPGIIKSYSYSMSFFIMAENPQITASEARRKSIDMMKGNKWRLFCLDFSFIGWYLLCLLTLGILTLWVVPYVQTAYAEFYSDLKSKQATQVSVRGGQEQNASPVDPFNGNAEQSPESADGGTSEDRKTL